MGSIGSSSQVNPSNYLDNFVINRSDIGIGGGIQSFKEYMKASGFTEDEVEQTRRLTSEHSGYHYEEADEQIVNEIESGTRIGQAFEARIRWEEAMYKAWVNKHKNEPNAYQYKIYDGEKEIYRKGNRKGGVEPWTSNEEGANMGSGGIGYDHKSTVEQLMKEGYHILGGVDNHLGSPGEAEITFIKYKKRSKR